MRRWWENRARNSPRYAPPTTKGYQKRGPSGKWCEFSLTTLSPITENRPVDIDSPAYSTGLLSRRGARARPNGADLGSAAPVAAGATGSNPVLSAMGASAKWKAGRLSPGRMGVRISPRPPFHETPYILVVNTPRQGKKSKIINRYSIIKIGHRNNLMDIALDWLRQTLIALEHELASHERAMEVARAKRDRVATLIQSYRTVIEHQVQSTKHTAPNGEPSLPYEGPQIPDERAPYASSEVLRNAIESILDRAGQPLHYRDIYGRLVENGIRVRGEDPLKNTGAHLSSDERFRGHGNGLWGLSKWLPRTSAPPLNSIPVTRPDGSIEYVSISEESVRPPQRRTPLN